MEINLAIWVPAPTSGGALYAACGALPPPPATLQWEYWNGKDWHALDLLKDETAAFTRSGHVYLNAPAKGSIVSAAIGKIAGARYWIRARLVSGSYQRAPRLLAVRTNTVGAVQAADHRRRDPGRKQRPARTGVPDRPAGRSSKVPCSSSSTRATAKLCGRRSLISSPPGRDDQHYVLNRTTGEIRFGNGRQGRIPVANAKRPANVIARQYRFGGGQRGNVGVGQLTSLRGSLGGIDAGAITNGFPAAGGGDEETVDEAKRRVPQTLKSRERAVTVEDFELHARAAGGIARAKALPLVSPRLSRHRGTGRRKRHRRAGP